MLFLILKSDFWLEKTPILGIVKWWWFNQLQISCKMLFFLTWIIFSYITCFLEKLGKIQSSMRVCNPKASWLWLSLIFAKTYLVVLQSSGQPTIIPTFYLFLWNDSVNNNFIYKNIDPLWLISDQEDSGFRYKRRKLFKYTASITTSNHVTATKTIKINSFS